MSGPDKEDDDADEVRGRDARLLVCRCGWETSISSSGRRGLGRRSRMAEDGDDGCGGGRRRWMGWWTEAGVGMGCSSMDGV